MAIRISAWDLVKTWKLEIEQKLMYFSNLTQKVNLIYGIDSSRAK